MLFTEFFFLFLLLHLSLKLLLSFEIGTDTTTRSDLEPRSHLVGIYEAEVNVFPRCDNGGLLSLLGSLLLLIFVFFYSSSSSSSIQFSFFVLNFLYSHRSKKYELSSPLQTFRVPPDTTPVLSLFLTRCVDSSSSHSLCALIPWRERERKENVCSRNIAVHQRLLHGEVKNNVMSNQSSSNHFSNGGRQQK